MGQPLTDTCGFGMSLSSHTPLGNMATNPVRAFLSIIFHDPRTAFEAQMAKKYLKVVESG
jgi:hypothetical protein